VSFPKDIIPDIIDTKKGPIMSQNAGRTDVKWTLIDTDSGFCALRTEWDELASLQPNASFFQTFTWAHTAWLVDLKPRGRRLHIIVGRRNGGRLAVIAPICRERFGPLRVARWLEPLIGGECDILVEPSADADILAAQAWIQIIQGPFDVVRCRMVRGSSFLWSQISATNYLYGSPANAPAIDTTLYESSDHYHKTRSKNLRENINQSRSRLRRSGKLETRIIENVADYTPILDWMLHHKMIWLNNHNEGTDSFVQGWPFVKRVCAVAHESGNVMLCQITVNGRTVAAALNFLTHDRFDYKVISMDYEWAKEGPGRLLIYEFVRWAVDRRIPMISLGAGGQPYKYRFANCEATVFLNPVVAASLAGAIALQMKKLIARAKTEVAMLRNSLGSVRFHAS
jgi:CelD/BcsL family acetyltransferase involved in cellulose biosynthesis